MIKIDFDIDYHNLKWDYTAPASKLMLYLQEAAILHSERAGLTMDWFFETKSGWVICDWDIELIKPLHWAERITIETFPSMFKGVAAHRGFIVYNKEGEIAAKASSRWVYTDRLRLRPIKVKSEMSEKYGELKPLPVETDFKIPSLTGEPIRQSEVTVARSDTDTNRHANNISYLLWVTNLLTDDEYNSQRITRLKIAYKKQCVAGDNIKVVLYNEAKRYYAQITDTDYTLLCELYFETE